MSISFTLVNGTTTASQLYINVKRASGVPTIDSTGNYTLTLDGTGVSLVTNDATRGNVLSFPGTGGFTTNFNLPIIHTRLFWVKFNNVGLTYQNNTLSVSHRPLWFQATNYMNFSMNYPGTVYTDSTNTVTTGVWYFYAFTYDGTTANLYRNGILDYSVNVASYATPEALFIAHYGGGSYLYGYLDNIRCYSTALTQKQIQDIYNYESTYPTSFYFENGFTYIPASIGFSPGTSAQFYINVKPDTVVPTTDDTGAFTLTNNVGAVALATDATRGTVLYFNHTTGFTTNYYLPIIHTRIFWVKLVSTSPYQNNTLSTDSRPLYFNVSTTIKFNMNFNGGGTTYVDTGTITTGVWYFYALTYDGITAKLYRNGVLNVTQIATSYQTPDILNIGCYNTNGGNLDGYLDNIRCYSRVLSQIQIQNIYNYESTYPTSFYYENSVYNFNSVTNIPPSIGYSYIITSGLAVYIDFTNPSCYSGSGTTFYNLIDNTAQAITVGSGLSARVSYTSSIGLRLNNSGISIATTPGVCLSLTTYTVQTISIWYKIYSIGSIQYLCDARTNPPSGSGLTSAGYVYSSTGPFGAGWNTAYVNGGSAIATSTATWAGVVQPTTPPTPWRNVTLVSSSSAVTYPTIAGRYPKEECLDCAVAFVLVYNRAITQDENASNYNALLSKMNALS